MMSNPLPTLNVSKKFQVELTTSSFLRSFALCLIILMNFLFFSEEEFWHWFVIPVLLCGTLIGVDVVDWLRGRLNIFSPVSILGILGLHFFFLAPLLHVYWDYWPLYLTSAPNDWRDWLGGMAVLNFLGLMIYRFTRNRFSLFPKKSFKKTVWEINNRSFPVVLGVALFVSAIIQINVYAQFGGIWGYIQAYEELRGNAFEGMGWIFMISERFPILLLIGYAVYVRKNRQIPSWTTLTIIVLVFLVLSLLFGGFRGSRSTTIWLLFWAAGIIHFWIRPLTKTVTLAGLAFVVIFAYMYGFFKAEGSEGLLLATQGKFTELEEKTARTKEGTLLHDLARSGVQGFILFKLFNSDYELTMGRTYLGALAILIPKQIWPTRPPHKVKEATEIRLGMGTYVAGFDQSSWVHGLAGETMLNFGPLAVPFSFILLGWLVGRLIRLLSVLEPTDTRWLLIPFLINLCFTILVADSDNILFFLIKNGAIPFLVILVGSKIRVLDSSNEKN